MDSLFPTAKIYSPHGQTYEAVDRKLLLSYKESEQGQILHEGISEAGAMASSDRRRHGVRHARRAMIPVYIFYSMFGFQRTGDQLWAMADQLGRGFLLGATAGRTTLNGEGLQHEDGHSPLLASTNPACVHYDPAWASSWPHRAGRPAPDVRPSEEHPHGEDVFYYLTLYNEPYLQPAEPADVDVDGLLQGPLPLRRAPGASSGEAPRRADPRLGRRPCRWALEAQRMLAEDWGVAADVWSATSWTELRREAWPATSGTCCTRTASTACRTSRRRSTAPGPGGRRQ